jgi:hypothetical protein
LPDKAFAKYALENALCIQDRELTELEKSFLQSPDANSQQMFDYYLNEIKKTNPELGREIQKVPDFKTVDVKKVEAIEDVLGLMANPRYKAFLYSMLNVGIKEKRRYCSPLQGLEWLAESMDFDSEYNNPMKDYSLEMFMLKAWARPAHNINSWTFEEATDRVNSPELCSVFSKMRISYVSYIGEQYPPKEVFEKGTGNCADQARLNAYFMLQNGYEKYPGKKTNSCCVFDVMFDHYFPGEGEGHGVCLYTDKDGKLKIIDIGGTIRGPFKTENDVATSVAKYRGVKSYFCR